MSRCSQILPLPVPHTWTSMTSNRLSIPFDCQGVYCRLTRFRI
jgi:hypothetical protein